MLLKAMRLVFAVGLGMCASVEGSNLLINGGFNGPVGNPNYTLKQRFMDIRPQGWSGGDKLVYLCIPGIPGSGDPSTDTVFDNNGGLATWETPGPSPDGGNYVISHCDPRYRDSIYQTVNNLTIGQVYTLTFTQASGQNVGYSGPTWQQWIVDFGGQIRYSDVMVTPAQGSIPWRLQTLTFTATAKTQTLTFLANGGDVVDGKLKIGSDLAPIAYLDAVNLDVVPEPGSLALSCLGIFGVRLLFRLRATSKPDVITPVAEV